MKKTKLILMVAVISLLTVLLGTVTLADRKSQDEAVLPEGITLQGQDLSGMTEAQAKETIQEYADTLLARQISLELNETVYEISMEELGVTWSNPEATEQVEGMSMSGNVIARYKKKKDVEKNPVDITIELTADTAAMETLIHQYVEACTIAVAEPSLVRTAEGFSALEGKTGISFDAEKIITDLEKYVSDTTETKSLEYTAENIMTDPETALDAYSGFKGDLLGTYTTYFKSSEANRSSNLRLGASKVNGHSYLPGEEFSILELLNPVTVEAGYLKAGTYENGQVVDGVGGGICQLATTVYDAALRAEMDITFRRNHSMVASYVPYAWDAMIYAESGSDFKFINNTDYPIYIEVGISEGVSSAVYEGDCAVTVSIYGTETRPSNRTIQFRSVTLNKEWILPIYTVVVDPNLPERATKEIIAAHPKVKAECWKDIYVGGILQESILINSSEYRNGTGVMSIGTDITFDAWSKPGADGWPEIYQHINYTSSLEESRRAEEESKRLEEESRKAAEQAAADNAAATNPEASLEDSVAQE